MKKLILFIPFYVTCACTEQSHSSEVTSDIIENIEPEANASSTFTIEGMTCEIGCVRTVKSHLSKMKGVIDINIDFDTARVKDYSTVNFDDRFVSEADIKAEIESIANGLYKVSDITQEQK
jgi:mercuric ion binding protein